jgi:glycosyltransferase involved in cell wall biosynthesis
MKKKILILTDFYLPGFTSGGAPEMVRNLVDHFFDQFDFHVVTRNYDSRTDRSPYTSVTSNAWNQVGNAKVFYCSKETLTRNSFARLIAEIAPDLVLLNSPFSKPSILFLSLRRRGPIRRLPVVLAACGALSDGSMSIRSIKKRVFLRFAAFAGFYNGVIWKASFAREKGEIEKRIGSHARIEVAPELMPSNFGIGKKGRTEKCSGSIDFVYFSRVERVKNLLYFLERLRDVDTGKISLKIIGPIEGKDYWRECENVFPALPPNITIDVVGALPRDEALRLVAENHFFVLPTLNENFGYALMESLAVGCPALITNNTVWADLEHRNAGWCVSLKDPSGWIEKIKRCIAMDQSEYDSMSEAARDFASQWLSHSDAKAANERLFKIALSGDHLEPPPLPTGLKGESL